MKYETENKRQAKLKAELKDAQNELQNLVEENNKLKTVFESLMHESRRFSSDIADYSEALLAQIKEKLPREALNKSIFNSLNSSNSRYRHFL
ncbi:hypothetical protein [Nitrosospira sp. NpAV]|uniref:hypothetical protein n=1 Tax=Nitrosospira sp. NpAV TaxID=58133 RepID=UPI0005A1B80C|nr:hypothetical protein [Nitrosospira sp. NpAV]KIO48681.1 hypothetical protein SQ11_10420 [Nitrosospira sp. NpAV]